MIFYKEARKRSSLLVSRSGEKESDEFESLKADQLRLRPQDLENALDAALQVEGRHQGRRVVAHQRHQHLEDKSWASVLGKYTIQVRFKSQQECWPQC